MADNDGVRLVDVATSLNLKTPTALRLLKALVGEGLIWFNPSSKTYHIGAELISLAAIANSNSAPVDRFKSLLSALSEAIGETVYLMIRRGTDAICVAIIEGRYPVRVMSFKVGEIRPLGVGSASLALLAFLPGEERDTILAQNAPRFSKYGFTRAKVGKMTAEARKLGYALNPGLLIDGVYGMGFPIFERGKLIASIGTMAIKERMGPAGRKKIAAAMRDVMAKFKT
jgi:DNA-binding IclR family transcriptional regulator